MFRLVIPIILIVISVAGFFVLTSPLYKDVTVLLDQASAYNQALANSKNLEAERDRLTKKQNSMNPDSVNNLQKLLPDAVDNIRLILEVEKIAAPYGMVLRDIKYNVDEDDVATPGQATAQASTSAVASRKNYGVWDLEFSTQGSYANFLNFIKDLERNLRIVDIASIEFSSTEIASTGATQSVPNGIYRYSFKIKTYWLKD